MIEECSSSSCSANVENNESLREDVEMSNNDDAGGGGGGMIEKGIVEKAGTRLYQKGQEIRAKLASKRQETPEGCTFQPTVNRRTVYASKVSTPEGKDRFHHLYENAQRQAKKHAEARRESETSRVVGSFQPEITAKSRRLSFRELRKSKRKDDDNDNDNDDDDNATMMNRFDRLYANAIETKARREKEREQKATEGCTFQPQINENVKGSSRVLDHAQKIHQKHAALLQKKEELALAGCTFQPTLIAKSSSFKASRSNSSHLPVHERMLAQEQRRLQKLDQLRKVQEEKEKAKLHFSPKISRTSSTRLKRAEDANSHRTVFERLHRTGSKKEMVQEWERLKQEQDKNACSFKPRISKRTSHKTDQESIFDRLYKDNEKKQAAIAKREQQRLEQEREGCTFAPQIVDLATATETESDLDHLPPPPAQQEPIWERLHSFDKNKVYEERQALKEKQQKEQCPFRPRPRVACATQPPATPSPTVLKSKTSARDVLDRMSMSSLSN